MSLLCRHDMFVRIVQTLKPAVLYVSEVTIQDLKHNNTTLSAMAHNNELQWVTYVCTYRFWTKLDIQNGRWWPFWKQNEKKSCILIWNGEKCDRKWFFGHPKWPPASILWNKFKKEGVAYWSEMARISYMQVKTKLLQFVWGASWNWLDYCTSEMFG